MLKKLFGTAGERTIKKYRKTVQQINQKEKELQNLSDEELKNQTAVFKERLSQGASLDDILVEVYATVKNTCRRLCGKEINVLGHMQTWDMIPYDVQIVGALAMHNGTISEMQTGEGKTLTSAMPLYLHALTGKPVHLVTVNDYLVERDCMWIGAIFSFLGITSKPLLNKTKHEDRRDVYEADIVYSTASEFGFDYLRDNSMIQSKDQIVQRGHFFVIIDEIDSILIDEARTPLIISGPAENSMQMYDELKSPVADLVKAQKDLCNNYASFARRELDSLKITPTTELSTLKFSKEEKEKKKEALEKLWLVSKGTPTNKVLKRYLQNPDIRQEIESIDTFYYSDMNKEARAEVIKDLYIIIDEKNQDYELIDKGVKQWKGDSTAFMMLDLGHEYALIEKQELNEKEALQKKVALREEDARRKEMSHNIRQLFRAQLLMEKDVDYIVQDRKIVIIDENTGRPQPGRRFSDGLHQAIEAKENLSVQRETQTLATITLQNYFRLYKKIAGMTGTAITESKELKEIYGLEVLSIPTHKKCIRDDINDEVYMSEREKYDAILKEIREAHQKGQPILVGTESVDVSEKVSRLLKDEKLKHTVLNAKNHAKEAEIISNAGKKSAITVATNMAGRGTDIKLEEGVADLGGLYVIGTTRHSSRRIDRQLSGRCARQGDPGKSKFYVSFEDPLMKMISSPRVINMLQRFRPPEGEAISAPILNRSIGTAQERVEARNYQIRKHTLEYDDVMNKHRSEVYTFRQSILLADNPLALASSILSDFTEMLCSQFHEEYQANKALTTERLNELLMSHVPINISNEISPPMNQETFEIIKEKVLTAFKSKLKNEGGIISAMQKLSGKEIDPLSVLMDVTRSILLRSIDSKWQKHLLGIDHLRTEVSMQSVAQKDPLQEFKHEAFHLFNEFSLEVKKDITHQLFAFTIMVPDAKELQNLISQMELLGPPPEVTESLSKIKL
ncbi:MAG: Protein translocase subunit SecA [Chlamydiia bacterium]|nr:Protein translocase subunit SecA [Chlamydiia bacterium]